MDYMNNASNSYSSGDTMSASLGNMSINDQHHQENGVQMGHQMKVRSLAFPSLQPSLVHSFSPFPFLIISRTSRTQCTDSDPPAKVNNTLINGQTHKNETVLSENGLESGSEVKSSVCEEEAQPGASAGEGEVHPAEASEPCAEKEAVCEISEMQSASFEDEAPLGVSGENEGPPAGGAAPTAKPATGVLSEFAFAAGESKPSVAGSNGEGNDFMSMGASCSLDPGSEAASGLDDGRVGECGKRLSDSLWASEDMQASRGSLNWTGVADSHRAISLDATECLSEISNPSAVCLVRSTALEDLTSIGDKGLWVDPGEELISSENTNDRLSEGAALRSCSDSGAHSVTPETQPHTHRLSGSGFDSGLAFHSEEPPPRDPSSQARSYRNTSDADTLLTNTQSDTATENNTSDSLLHRVADSKSDISNDSEMNSVALTTGSAELQKTRQSSPARKSLVPVAIFKAQAKMDNGSAEKKQTATKATSSPKRPPVVTKGSKLHASSRNGPSSIPIKTRSTEHGQPTAGVKSQTPGAKTAARTQPASAKKLPTPKFEKDAKSGQSSPGTPKSPSSQAQSAKSLAEANKVKKVAVVRSTPKSPGSLKSRPPAPLAAAAPMPDLKNVKSKIGSTDNLKHQPGGGRVQILDQKVDYSTVQSKCGSKGNLKHVPGGGNVQILDKKMDLSNVQSRCGSKDNLKHTPGGGKVKILDQKVDYSNVQSKCGSKDNMKHAPGGGNVQIVDKKLDLTNVQSRCGSKDNIKHVPGGGNIQIVHKKIDLSNVQSKCGSKDNIRHKPGGGNIEIKNEKLEFKVQSKIGSLDNIGHVPGGGQRKKGKEGEGSTSDSPSIPSPAVTPPLSPQTVPSAPTTPILTNPLIKIEDSY
ncbi:microtubule-associated protein tau isoform X5 [Sphaeramia orbicularis]|uniref:microtubule-associated protein tau isoform X5 n=1 Tax=Sphaeramia orbicularis TaxID=375764 RepID=UPI00117FB70F|nr:microtubule-associated protein tau-like isoform X5 [Sphaeramia orbicularis]